MSIRIPKHVLPLIIISGSFLLLFIFGVYVFGNPQPTQSTNSVNLLAVFITGLLTGGLTCLAVQGGLLASTIAQREEEKFKENLERKGNALPIISFLIAKLIAYTILGFFLGWFGSLLSLSLQTMAILQITVGIFMIGTALNMLSVHPIFRYFVIQPPKFLTRIVRKRSKSKDIFAPAVIGALTVFIPCGTTQAIMALAIGSANPFLGALILFSFILGTSPIFFLLGFLTTKLSETLHLKFIRFVAILIILLSLFTINNAFTLLGRGITFGNLFAKAAINSSDLPSQREVNIYIVSSGYFPKVISVKQGEQVILHIINKDAIGCQAAFAIPKLGIQKIVRPGTSETLIFTAPDAKQDILFTCTMGMYTGVIRVI